MKLRLCAEDDDTLSMASASLKVQGRYQPVGPDCGWRDAPPKTCDEASIGCWNGRNASPICRAMAEENRQARAILYVASQCSQRLCDRRGCLSAQPTANFHERRPDPLSCLWRFLRRAYCGTDYGGGPAG